MQGVLNQIHEVMVELKENQDKLQDDEMRQKMAKLFSKMVYEFVNNNLTSKYIDIMLKILETAAACAATIDAILPEVEEKMGEINKFGEEFKKNNEKECTEIEMYFSPEKFELCEVCQKKSRKTDWKKFMAFGGHTKTCPFCGAEKIIERKTMEELMRNVTKH